MDNIQKPTKSPDCLLGVVPQPTDSRLSETIPRVAGHFVLLTLNDLASCKPVRRFTAARLKGCSRQ